MSIASIKDCPYQVVTGTYLLAGFRSHQAARIYAKDRQRFDARDMRIITRDGMPVETLTYSLRK